MFFCWGVYVARDLKIAAQPLCWGESSRAMLSQPQKARQGFFPDGSRSFEEIDRLQIGEKGAGNLISEGRGRLLSGAAAVRLYEGSAGRPAQRYRRGRHPAGASRCRFLPL
jgi:hypothetical protein